MSSHKPSWPVSQPGQSAGFERVPKKLRGNRVFMKLRCMAAYAAIVSITSAPAYAELPLINSLDRNGNLTWTYGFDSGTSHVAHLEMSTNLNSEVWTPFVYDFVSTN